MRQPIKRSINSGRKGKISHSSGRLGKQKTNFYFSRGNHKLSKDQLVWSLPRVLTCPGRGSCEKYCYAKKAERTYKNVLPSRMRNWEFSKSKEFVDTVVEYLRKSGKTIVRVHESGDLYSQEYLNKWKQIARKLPEIRFYAFTKSFKLNLWKDLPKNLVIIQSYGSRYDHLIDPKRSTARVIDDTTQVRKGEYLCPYHKVWFDKCGTSCAFCYSDYPKVKHIVFQRH